MKSIGIVGGGQLGRMMAFDAKRMGYQVIILDPTPEAPAGQVSDQQLVASFDDYEALHKLASMTDVVTYEFEHINAEILMKLESKGYKIFPSGKTLRIIQNKYMQKSFLKEAGLPVPDFYSVRNKEEIMEKSKVLGFPLILKTCTGGYDGKGNMVLESEKDVENIPEAFLDRELMLEQYISFTRELSVMVARSQAGEIVHYPIAENEHRENILRLTKVPAQMDVELDEKIRAIAAGVMQAFNDIGVFCIELFQENGNVYINEIAPRPHNSGHYTIEACITSQYEQLIRIITGLPLGSTRLLSQCAMVNILGSENVKGEYTFHGIENALKEEAVYLHLYGKKSTAPLRKIGHITVLDNNTEAAAKRAKDALDCIKFIALEGK
ncbi:MAG: 5-(carboxyamino)imidazole ribonucleotide synthase [Bacillota bacterium]